MNGNSVATHSFDRNVCTLFRLRNVNREIFCFIFRRLRHLKISTKQPQKWLHSFCNSSDYTLLTNKSWFHLVFFQACAQCITFGTTLVYLIFPEFSKNFFKNFLKIFEKYLSKIYFQKCSEFHWYFSNSF